MTTVLRDRPAVVMLAAVIGLTMLLAWPVLCHPNTMIFGAELVGRHPDPFSAMAVFADPSRAGARLQPATDLLGHLLARAGGPIAAYNAVVLMSFPAAAVAAYVCGRVLHWSRAAASVAGAAFAFTPQHLAQAAYHPHVAQTQWLPLAVAAAAAVVARPSMRRLALLAVAVAMMVAADFYAALVAIEVLPMMAAAIWWATRTAGTARAALRAAAFALVISAVALLAASAFQGPDAIAYAASASDARLYAARWWSFLLPPLHRGVLNGAAEYAWARIGAGPDLLEQQTAIDWGIGALALVGVVSGLRREGSLRRRALALAAVGMWAAVCATQAWAHALLPAFRANARIGISVALVAALAAGLGAEALWRETRARSHKAIAVLILVVAAIDVFPTSARARDVMPTAAHRWLAASGAPFRALDCAAAVPSSSMDGWLEDNRVALMADPFADCSDPHLSDALAVAHVTDVIVRRGAGATPPMLPVDDALIVRAVFDDSLVLGVPRATPEVATIDMPGFFDVERRGRERWRWMGAAALWRVANTQPRAVRATLEVRVAALDRTRAVALRVDGRPVARIDATTAPAWRTTAPFTLGPGVHDIQWVAGPATVSADDRRPLTIRVFDWRWSAVEGDRP